MSAPSELTARCTVVVAAAGYGKTEAVRRWLRSARPRWHKGSIPAPLDPGWHVVDDLTGPSGSEIDALLDRLTHQPSTNVVLVSRAPLPRPSGPTDASLIDERGPIDLALTTAEIAEVLHERLGPRADHLAATVHDLTAGWPSLVHLVAEQLARLDGITDADLATGTIGAAAIAGPGSALAAFVAKHVLEPLPRPAARLVPTIAQLGAIDENRYVALGYRRATPSIDHLTRIGLIDITGEKDRRLVPVLGQVAIDRWPLAQPERADLFARAGAWYAEHGQPRAAIEAYRVAGDSRSCARLLRDHGPSWVHAGGAATIIEAVASLSPADRTPPIRLLHGEALLVVGDDERALAELTALAELVASSDGDVPTAAAGPLSPAPTGHLPAGLAGRLPASLAWRLAAAYCQRADPDTASMMVGLVRPDETSVADHALVLAWTATARWLAGDLVGSGDFARRALQTAERANDDRARGAAHVALAMHAMLTGDRSGTMAHYDQALRYARAAHDVVQEVRIHNNQAARLLEEALYPQALDQARQATALATASGCGAMLPAAVCNEAESLFRLGRLDEAMACYTRALNLFQARRSGKLAYPLIGIGAIHRIQGRLSLARAAYEEAYRASTATGNVQALIPALAGLARVLAGTDPSEAVRFAALAREAASGPHVAEAALATGWAWLGAGDRSAAIRSAVEASDEARRHRDSRGLAEALELQAAATDHPAQRRRLLGEAADTWCLAGATLDRDRVVAALGSLPTASVAERIEARLARERLETAGVVLPTMAVLPGPEALKPVVIRTLGRFEVMVGETMVTDVAVPQGAGTARHPGGAPRPRDRPGGAERAAVARGRARPGGTPTVRRVVDPSLGARPRPCGPGRPVCGRRPVRGRPRRDPGGHRPGTVPRRGPAWPDATRPRPRRRGSRGPGRGRAALRRRLPGERAVRGLVGGDPGGGPSHLPAHRARPRRAVPADRTGGRRRALPAEGARQGSVRRARPPRAGGDARRGRPSWRVAPGPGAVPGGDAGNRSHRRPADLAPSVWFHRPGSIGLAISIEPCRSGSVGLVRARAGSAG